MKGAVITIVLGQGFDLVGGFFIAADVLDLGELFKSFSNKIKSLHDKLSNKLSNALSSAVTEIYNNIINMSDLISNVLFLFVMIFLYLPNSRYSQILYFIGLLGVATFIVHSVFMGGDWLLRKLTTSLDKVSSVLLYIGNKNPRRLAWVGFTCLSIGFMLQIIGTICQNI